MRRRIEATDRQIDALVYQLYGLTDDEIKLVEQSTQSSKDSAEIAQAKSE